MQIERVSVDILHCDPANVRKHGEKNLKAIKASLTKFGQQKPIVVDAKNVVLAGNGTLAAAKELGWPMISIVRTELTGTDATGYAISDNRTSELAEWDFDGLAKQLAELDIAGFDLAEFGFDPGWNDPTAAAKTERIEKDGATELDESEFSVFQHKCPKCGFEYDDDAKKA